MNREKLAENVAVRIEELQNTRWKGGFLMLTWGAVAAQTISETKEYPLMAIYSFGAFIGTAAMYSANRQIQKASRILNKLPAPRNEA